MSSRLLVNIANHEYSLINFIIIIIDPGGIFDEFLPFYDLQSIPEVEELPKTQDAHSPPIFVPGGIVFGADEITQIFVNNNIITYCG